MRSIPLQLVLHLLVPDPALGRPRQRKMPSLDAEGDSLALSLFFFFSFSRLHHHPNIATPSVVREARLYFLSVVAPPQATLPLCLVVWFCFPSLCPRRPCGPAGLLLDRGRGIEASPPPWSGRGRVVCVCTTTL
ncbi:hypothetical protein B0T24DRAFT_124410 [Lasiosphaeria ovina]|uniref:Secreted protein n=1 Tax=Lasiosphaeria ovina TaxID=92902 RepID=A0AAE0JS90_9PEZI|nr:hypothetical protein B0T24DRAFT_124410 [Lasiosphaeria ovina]